MMASGGRGDCSYSGGGDGILGDTPSPLKINPKKQKLHIDLSKCIICQEIKSQNLVIPQAQGLSSLHKASDDRQDDVFHRLNEDPRPKDEQIRYHRICYSSYASKQNISCAKKRKKPLSNTGEEEEEIKECPSMRSNREKTDWKLCVICQKRTHDSDRVLHKVLTTAIEVSFKDAAKRRKDDKMMTRINTVDLIAIDALYHKTCMATYKNERNIKAATKATSTKATSTVGKDAYDKAFSSLLSEIHDDLLIQKKVFTMVYLMQRFKNYFPETVDVSILRAEKLKNRIAEFYGDDIQILTQQGQSQSTLILTQNVSIIDALKTASKLRSELKSCQMEMALEADMTDPSSCENDYTVLHKAAGILRKTIDGVPNLKADMYPTAQEISIDASKEFVPEKLRLFIQWIIDTKSFLSAKEDCPVKEDTLRHVLSVAECLIHCGKKVITPLHLGLAAGLHKMYGKRHIIDLLHRLGYSVSYDEFSRFNTSIAKDQLSTIQSGVYIPPGIVPYDKGGALVQEADDNVDHNAETIDGKNTLHAMARVVFQLQTGPQQLESAKLVGVVPIKERSLELSEEVQESLTKCLEYSKPPGNPEPPKQEAAMEKIDSVIIRDTSIAAKDLTWLFLRNIPRDIIPYVEGGIYINQQVTPFWTGYNYMQAKSNESVSIVGFKPIIDAPPADMATVYTTMKQNQEMTKALNQKASIQTFDQQLYSIAQKVKWNSPEEFPNHVLRLGGFHTLCNYIAALGKIWGDAGLKDMLIDSDLYAASTVEQMLCGKQFNRAVRGLLLAYEALSNIYLEQFFKWGEENGLTVPDEVWLQMIDAQKAMQTANEELIRNAVQELQCLLLEHVIPELQRFRKLGEEHSPTLNFGNQFLDACEHILQCIRAEREGNWSLHLHSISSILPYMFVGNRIHYSRWLPAYILDMLELPEEVEHAFNDGHFAVKETTRRFNGIWSDMAAEKTVIRDTKSDAGIIGFTRKEPAVIKWTLTRHILGEYAATLNKRCGFEDNVDMPHDQCKTGSMARDENDVKKLNLHIKEKMTNPFNVNSHVESALVHLTSGLHASEDVKRSLLGIVDTGHHQAERFVSSSLATGGQRSFYHPIQKSGLQTFTSMVTKTKLNVKGKAVHVKVQAELVFRRALTLSKVRENISMESVLSLPLTNIPTALFHEVGSVMRSNKKADLLHLLEEISSPQLLLPSRDTAETVYIRDAMAEFHRLEGKAFNNFNALAQRYIQQMAKGLEIADTVVDVFDQYKEDSVKTQERAGRANALQINLKWYDILGGRPVPPWKGFLAVPSNKVALASFIADYMSERGSQLGELREDKKTICLTGTQDDKVRLVNNHGVSFAPNLECTQEEADTRMIWHTALANQLFLQKHLTGRVIIKSPDTDVLVLAIYYFPKFTNINELWLETGRTTATKDLRRFIPVHEICHSQTPIFCEILPAMHALTGCDSTSSFFKLGKKKVFSVIQDNTASHFSDLATFGQKDIEEEKRAARKLIALLYDSNRKHGQYHDNLNTLRSKIASMKDVAVAQLPPAEASFEQHVKRAMWQTRVWTSAHIARPVLGSPMEYGWKMDGGTMTPILFEGDTSAEKLQELVCNCKATKMCARGCTCTQAGISCCAVCPCFGIEEECFNEYTKTIIDDE